jgi:hypothetical protein
MGNLQQSLAIKLGDKSCDMKLPKEKDKSGDLIDQQALMFSPTDQMILRQYECASEPVVLLSKFFQLDVPTSHLVPIHF